MFAKMKEVHQRIGDSHRYGHGQPRASAHLEYVRQEIEHADPEECSGAKEEEHAGAVPSAPKDKRQGANHQHRQS